MLHRQNVNTVELRHPSRNGAASSFNGPFNESPEMKKPLVVTLCTSFVMVALFALILKQQAVAQDAANDQPTKAAVDRSRKTISMLDNIYKNTIVLITDKYVHDEDDFAAGSAAVLLFKNVSESGSHNVRLIDATGDPYDSENVAKDDFEREAIKQLKAGAKQHEQVVTKKGSIICE